MCVILISVCDHWMHQPNVKLLSRLRLRVLLRNFNLSENLKDILNETLSKRKKIHGRPPQLLQMFGIHVFIC